MIWERCVCKDMSSCLPSSVPMSILLMLALAVLSWILTSVMSSHSLPVNPLSCPQSSFSRKLMGSNHPFTASHPCTMWLLSPLFYHCFHILVFVVCHFHTLTNTPFSLLSFPPKSFGNLYSNGCAVFVMSFP